MSWTQQIFNYCERATDPHFWGEPLNAVTNLAFILAAILAFKHVRKQPHGTCGYFHYILIAVVFLIGLGSGLFHTLATRWSALADVLPIVVFIFLYLYFAMRNYLSLSILASGIGILLFIGLNYVTSTIKCEGGPCLNGTIGYVPALAALVCLGFLSLIKKHKAAISLLTASVVFTCSAIFRSIDISTCPQTTIGHYPVGTHFMWHILNALTLYILLRAAVLYGHTKQEKSEN